VKTRAEGVAACRCDCLRHSLITIVASSYLSEQLRYIADMPARIRLRSSSTSLLDVRPSRRVTVGDRSFATAGPRIWNTLPCDVTSATSLLSFRRKLLRHTYFGSHILTLLCDLRHSGPCSFYFGLYK